MWELTEKYSGKRNPDTNLFLPFENKTDITLNGSINIVDAKSKKSIFSKKFSKKPTGKLQKAGVKISKSIIYPSQKLQVQIKLNADGINEVEKTSTISIASKEITKKVISTFSHNQNSDKKHTICI